MVWIIFFLLGVLLVIAVATFWWSMSCVFDGQPPPRGQRRSTPTVKRRARSRATGELVPDWVFDDTPPPPPPRCPPGMEGKTYVREDGVTMMPLETRPGFSRTHMATTFELSEEELRDLLYLDQSGVRKLKRHPVTGETLWVYIDPAVQAQRDASARSRAVAKRPGAARPAKPRPGRTT